MTPFRKGLLVGIAAASLVYLPLTLQLCLGFIQQGVVGEVNLVGHLLRLSQQQTELAGMQQWLEWQYACSAEHATQLQQQWFVTLPDDGHLQRIIAQTPLTANCATPPKAELPSR